MTLRSATFAAAFALLPVLGAPAWAATTIDVTIWDKGADAEMATAMGYGAGEVDHAKLSMGLKLSHDSAPAGDVTFKVTNSSKDTVHEMLVLPISTPGQAPTYVENESRIDEEAAGHLGEVAELDPGQSGALTLDLEPGEYLLVCNIPGHYMAGMWQVFTVTP
ncbi:MAG: hypothetical protein KDK07_16745 [Bauldia sp.]|nr:hypothetical protein [Bauldia sp.]